MGLGLGAIASLSGLNFLEDLTSGFVNNYYNRKAASRQYGYEKSLIDYQNEYNLPVNQRKRLEDAGLNPNLLYGGSTVNSVSADGHAPSVRTSDFKLNSAQTALSLYNMELQNKLLEAQVKRTNAETDATDLKQVITGLQEELLRDRVDTIKTFGYDPQTIGGSLLGMPVTAIRMGATIGSHVGNALSENLPVESLGSRMSRNALELARQGRLNLEYDPVIDRYYYISKNKKQILNFGKNLY